jgi:hypothetical protein
MNLRRYLSHIQYNSVQYIEWLSTKQIKLHTVHKIGRKNVLNTQAYGTLN